MSGITSEIWGLTRKMDVVHYFRDGRSICPTSKGHGHGWLFVSRPDWTPEHPFTCEKCRKILDFEKKESQVSPVSPLSPAS
jgi:hypothetical protein